MVGIKGVLGTAIGHVRGTASASDVVCSVVEPITDEDAQGDGYCHILSVSSTQLVLDSPCCRTTRPPRISGIDTCSSIGIQSKSARVRCSYLGNVQGHHHGQLPDSQARDSSSCIQVSIYRAISDASHTDEEHREVHGGALDDGADEEHDHGEIDGALSTEAICDGTVHQGTEPGGCIQYVSFLLMYARTNPDDCTYPARASTQTNP